MDIPATEKKLNKEAEIVFLNSVFPVLSETFLFEQYTLLLKQNTPMAIVSSNQVDNSQIHPNMRHIQQQVDYLCEAPLKKILYAHLFLFSKHPFRYLLSYFQALFMQEKFKVSLAHITGAALVFCRYKKLKWIHSHFTYGSTAIALWLTKITQIPYSITLHGADLTFDNPADLELKLQKAAHIFSISEFNINYVKQNFQNINSQNSSIIPLGVSRLNVGELQNNTNEKKLTLLNVGRLSEHKAQHLLIEACAILKKMKLDFQCYIIGEGPKRSELELLIQNKGLEEQVILLGAVYHNEVLQWYSKVDVFVLSSITEGMPLVIMEAMQKKLVVVAPELSGIPELLDQGRAGVLFKPGDVGSLVENLKRVIDGSVNLQELRDIASNYIQDKFDVDKNTFKFQQRLLELINNQPLE